MILHIRKASALAVSSVSVGLSFLDKTWNLSALRFAETFLFLGTLVAELLFITLFSFYYSLYRPSFHRGNLQGTKSS